MPAISWSLSSSAKISSFDSKELSGALLCLCSSSHFLSSSRRLKEQKAAADEALHQPFVFRNIRQINLVRSNRTSFVSMTFNKSKFLHWDLHLRWASTVYVCFFLATSRIAYKSSFAVNVSFTSNFPLSKDMSQLS